MGYKIEDMRIKAEKSLLYGRLMVCIVITMLLVGCAQSIGQKLSISKIPDFKVPNLDVQLEGITVRVEKFDDRRATPWIAKIDNKRSLYPDGDIGRAVQLAFERALRLNGAKISQNAPMALAGSVEVWEVQCTSKFLRSSAQSQTLIMVHLLDNNNNVVYTGKYSASVEKTHPRVVKEIDRVLGESMGMAISEALKDEKLVKAMRMLALG